ncbi:MAG: superoxide dismutase family protein [Erythrobacter sp.]
MRNRTIGSLVVFTTLVSACASIDSLPDERIGEATLRLSNGVPVGTAQLLRHGDSIRLSAVVGGLEPGLHGFHLHTVGKCIAPDFSSAGGHLNPGSKAHGSMSPNGSHLGDLPNLEIAGNHSATIQVDLTGSATQVMAAIFDADGSAIVVHAKADDYRTDPSGDAGSRIACGVIEAT